MEQSTTILNESKPYCCTLLHKTSYWSSSSVVIALLHIKALFYSNLEILWKLKFFKLFENFITLNFFEILWNFLKFWNFMKILNLKKSNYYTWTWSIWGFMEQSTTIWLRLVQYCCTLLHKTSYWSCSSAVIVYYFTARLTCPDILTKLKKIINGFHTLRQKTSNLNFVTTMYHVQIRTYSKNSSFFPRKFSIYRSCIKSSIEVLKYN
jgi:hypothetical protein